MRWAFALLCAMVFTGFTESISAREIRRIVFLGNTVDIGLDDLAVKAEGTMTETDMEALSVEVTNRYHRKGFTTTHVEKVFVRRDGIIEMRIKESKIAGIVVSGISGAFASRLKEILVPVPGEIFNRNSMHERGLFARRELGLSRLDISVSNSGGGSDVYLKVYTSFSKLGRFRGGVWYEPIYGLSPALSYTRETDDAAVVLRGDAGYRDGEFSKISGSARVYAILTKKISLFAEYEMSWKNEIWESADLTYLDMAHTPFAGVRYSYEDWEAAISAGKSFVSLEGYGSHSSRQSDLHADFSIRYANRDRFIVDSGSTGIDMSLRCGHSTITKNEYLKGELSAFTIMSPTVWIKLRPRVLLGHVTSDERYLWTYVFDKNLAGFPGDYTATSTRFVTGLDLEFEAFPETLFAGPFINTGRYLDEFDTWDTKTGGGAKLKVRLGSFFSVFSYAWDLAGNVADGGLVFSAEGTF